MWPKGLPQHKEAERRATQAYCHDCKLYVHMREHARSDKENAPFSRKSVGLEWSVKSAQGDGALP
jgi:hypothetical protein